MSAKRRVYLRTIPPEEAVGLAKQALDRQTLIQAETIPSHLACGRVTAGPVYARSSSPTFHAAAMDGIAVRAEDTYGAHESTPLTLEKGKTFVPVNTGHPLPQGCDAVIMIEQVQQPDDHTAVIEAPAFPWQHVRRIGEDIVATELLLPQNRLLDPPDVAALLSAGVYEVAVWERVRIGFAPTGDEVLDFLDKPEPGPGQVIESNSQMLASLAGQWGAEVVRMPPVADNPEALEKAVLDLADQGCHVVVLGAGSSAGSHDFSHQVFAKLGTVLAHGISVMPGKPSLVGVRDGRLLVGAPGYPVSAHVCFDRVLGPLACWLGRRSMPVRPRVEVRLARKLPSRPGLEELVRLAVGEVGGEYVAAPLNRGAGVITSLVRAQAQVSIPPENEGLEENQRVEAELFTPLDELKRVLVHVGSHDNTLDLLANEFMALPDHMGGPLRLVSSHAGSLGGLAALARGGALFAGTHLFDPETGDFNFSFLAKHLPGVPVALVNLAIRHQGLIIAPGNPRNIRGVKDLAREDVRFVNRQRGAGTRILLDHHLRQADIAPDQVQGYGDEEFTHMGVAVNVATGAADCGLGIKAAANALGLDFAPLARERYDLAIPEAYLDDPRIKVLLEVVRSQAFQDKIKALGGYETDLSGKVMKPGQCLEA